MSQEEHARKSLRQALSVLRRDLPDALFVATRDEIHVDPEAARIDVLEFERLSGTGQRGDLERAIDLYRGELLEGFHSRADGFDDWLLAERKRLRERAISAIGRVLDLQRAQADLKGATQSAMRMVSLDPLHEAAHCLLMQLYAEQGRLGDALDQYENCRQVLERELGHGPSASTAQLLAELRSRRTPSALPSAAPEMEAGSQLRVVAVLAIAQHDTERGTHHGESVAQVVREHGGLVLRRSTNSVVAAFGVVRSQGSEAVRACATAQHLLALTPGAGFGVSLAQAMVTRTDGTPSVMGEAVSQALHLASSVAAGRIAVSESVRQALSNTTFCQGAQPAPQPQRDADAKVTAWVLGQRADPSESAARTAFVGRARELAVLRATLASCQTSQLGQLVRIRGEAGIGKTRLLEELSALAERDGFRIHRAAALDFGRRNERDVVAQLTRSLLLRRAAAADEANGPLSSRDHGLLLGLANLDEHPSSEAADKSVREARAERQRELWLELWQRELAQGPTLVALEDLHWAEEAAFDQLAALLNLAHSGPLLMVATSRREPAAESPRWRGALRSCAVLSLDLGPFTGTESRQLAERLAVTDAERVSAAVQRSGGHPLFLEQMLRAERPVHLTPSIHMVVQTRVDQLAPREAAALRAAAVLGQKFEIGSLRELIDGSTAAPGDVPTEALLRSGLIRQASGKFMFSHAMIRDAVYETLPPAARRSLHAKAAEVVRHTDLALRAEHLERATDPAAGRAYLEAAEDADRRERVAEALKLAERGLALASDPELSFTLLETRVHLLQRLGQRDAAEQTARDALAVATTQTQAARAWVSLAECLRGTPRGAEALTALDAAESATRPDDHGALSHIHYLRGNVLFPQARVADCLSAHLRALKHAQQARSPRAAAGAL
ncbi:MAG TPA: BTAD domain-containing putative transcriptional regulator, partial [Polyangiaceae bacterium]|nr:BTAD domain-containing putative transcriptional regulator [Polyangiaceae bacterium]